MNLRKRKKEPPDLTACLYGSLFGGRFPSTRAMSSTYSEYLFHRHPYPGLNLCHCSVHHFCFSLLHLKISDLSLPVLADYRSSVFFGISAWPSHLLVPAPSPSQIGPNFFCVGLGDSQQAARVCHCVCEMLQPVDGAAYSAHLEEIGRSLYKLSQGLRRCSDQTVTEGQLIAVSFLTRLLGFRSESQVCFLLLFPYSFRVPCCHSLLLGLIIPIAGCAIFLTITLVVWMLSRVKIPSLWLCMINLFRRFSYVCSCKSPVCTRYTILSILSAIVMTTLPEALRLVLWYLSLWTSACLYKARRSLKAVCRNLLNLAKTICLGKLTFRNLQVGSLELQANYAEYVNHGAVPLAPCCCWVRIMLCADLLLERLAPLCVFLGLFLVVCPTTPIVQCLPFRASCVRYAEQHVPMCSLCRRYTHIIGQSSNWGWFVLIRLALRLVFWEDGIAVFDPHGGASRRLAVCHILCFNPALLSLLLSSLVLFLLWLCLCGAKPLEFGPQFSQWAKTVFLGLILVLCSSITFVQSLPLRPSCVTYLAQHGSMCSRYRMYSVIDDHSSKGGWYLLIMMTLSSSLSVLWIKHTLFWGIPSLWISLLQVSPCAQMLGTLCLRICWHWALFLNDWDEVKGQYPLVYEDEFTETSFFCLAESY